MDTLPRTRASPEPMGHNRGRETWETTCVLCNAQAACGFSCSASKRSSFFQSVKAMAAIFLANVRRAISGFIPELTQRTHTTAGSGGGSFEDLFHFVVVIPIETANLLRFFRTL